MKTKLFILILFWSYCTASFSQTAFSSFELAKQYPLVQEGPAPDFFEGALIGNGGLGAVVSTRPDAIMIRFGHNNVWDIRIAENNKKEIGTFSEIFKKVKRIDTSLILLRQDPWFNDYAGMARENYAKPYPRPFPCGSLVLGFDRRKVEVIQHRLDISSGLVKVELLIERKKTAFLEVFTERGHDNVWMRLVDETGQMFENCFNRIRLMPDSHTPTEFPPYEVKNEDNIIAFRQVMPYLEPDEYEPKKGHPEDRAFSLGIVTGPGLEKRERINWDGNIEQMADLEFGMLDEKPFWACASLKEGQASSTGMPHEELRSLKNQDFEMAYTATRRSWENYWSKSGVMFDDKILEEIWYRNLYFFNCAAKAGVNCPGLFANWSFGDIGSAWHGDYHMNYNTQQPFWATFSSNHLELNLPYVEMVEFISGVAKIWAKEYYEMRGAYYPHSAYPVEMTMNPYPVPTWGWEICETPWSIQGVWWHYLYSGDQEFLESRAFPLIKDAVLFLVDYMTRPEAHGPQWGDNDYHIFPTVPPELYGLRPGFKFNSDCLVDLTLVKFMFNAYLESVALLALENNEKEIMEILSNSKKNLQIEGGNELVFQHMQAARIGMLDMEAFKREIIYNLLPNGTCSNNVLQVHGRYNDLTDPYFMAGMGIWFENFGLPAVINECLMQSYNGTIRLFPNWPENQEAQFETLRAAGGFLVSSSLSEGNVGYVRIMCENDNTLRIYNPWDSGVNIITGNEQEYLEGKTISVEVKKGQSLLIQPYLNQ